MAQENDKTISLGQYLLKKRQEKGLSLEKISQDTKILISYLKAIEEDKFDELPPPAYLKAIIKKYAQYLRLNQEEVIDLLTQSNHRKWSAGKNDLPPKNRFFIPQVKVIEFLRNFFSRFLKFSLVFLIIFYILYEISFLILPPKIILDSPKEDFSTSNKELVISGKVIRAKSVLLKDQPLTLDERGNFSYNIVLTPGLNQIEIKAINHLGKETTIIRNINYLEKD